MVRAIIFDYFGVIQPDVLLATYRFFGGDPERDQAFIHDTINAVNHGYITSSRPVIAKRLGITTEQWVGELDKRRGHDPDLLAYILELRKHYKTGLLSNIGPGGLQVMWPAGELEKYFDVFIASGDVGYTKPQPEIYKLMAQKLGVEPNQCVMIDDLEKHCDGARQASMQAIQYAHFGQCKTALQKLLTDSKQ
ncbi:MAG TPA: HAD family phosphatase [Candidatus Saccharimonadales bacterium]|nr:HAD family phosphatase [Candidatus Saccharimonadales bacterium]